MVHFLGILILFIPAGCSPESRQASETPAADQTLPDILLITSDTTRSSSLGAYGCPTSRMPNLDRLALSGAVFANHISTSPTTSPAHASMFTGLYPDRHKVYSNEHTLHPSFQTLAAMLTRRGYVTHAYLGAYVLSAVSNGFQHLHLPETVWRRSGTFIDEAVATYTNLTEAPAESSPAPVFIWVHSYDPHYPYSPPPPFAGMFADVADSDRPVPFGDPSVKKFFGYCPELPPDYTLSQYLGELSYWDSQLGKLLRKIRRDRNTLVIFAGDHGENLGEGGMYGHCFLTREVLSTPLIIRYAGDTRLTGPRVAACTAQQSDILPTILAILGIRLPELRADGRNLLPFLPTDREPGFSPAFSFMPLTVSLTHPQSGRMVRLRQSASGDPLALTTPQTQQDGYSDSIQMNQGIMDYRFDPYSVGYLFEYTGYTPVKAATGAEFVFCHAGPSCQELHTLNAPVTPDGKIHWRIVLPAGIDDFYSLFGEDRPFFVSSRPEHWRYCVRLFDDQNSVLWVSSWMQAAYRDYAPPPEDRRLRIVNMWDGSAVEEGEPYRAGANAWHDGLVQALHRVLRRPDGVMNTKREYIWPYRAELPLTQSVTPEEVFGRLAGRKNPELLRQERNQKEALRELGYIQ